MADRPLRVLLVTPETTGGIGQHVRSLSEGLTARGHSATVCAPATTLERLNVGPLGVRHVAMPVGGAASLLVHRRALARLAAAHDVTHGHGVRAGAQAAVAGVRPLVVTWHNAPLGSPTRQAVHSLLERIAARRADIVLGASADLVLRARAAGAADARLSAVAAPRGSADAPPARAAGPAYDGPPTVLAVARLHPQKRLDLLIAAAAAWPPGPDRPRFLVAGDGPLLGPLQEQVRATGAPVTFLGARTDVPSLLAAADVVVLASDWEARPLVAQEALRAGVPLVATDVGGVRDLVGTAAVLVPPGSATALAEGIRAVLGDGALRQQLRRAGPRQAARWPTVEEMIDELVSLYLDLRSRVRP